MNNNHEDIHAKLQYFIATKKIPNIIFHGESGSGKRTILNDFLQKIYDSDRQKMKTHIMTVECCHGKGIKFIREDLKFFAKAHIQSNHGANFKTIVLLNADSLTIDAQSALRRCIELFSHNTRFFILVENKERLLNPILSRFCEIYVSSRSVKPSVPLEPTMVEVYRNAKSEGSNMNLVALVALSVQWCEQGYSAHDWIQCLQQQHETDVATRRIYIALCYHKIKPDFRCEKMLMFYVLYFTFVSSKCDLENMLL